MLVCEQLATFVASPTRYVVAATVRSHCSGHFASRAAAASPRSVAWRGASLCGARYNPSRAVAGAGLRGVATWGVGADASGAGAGGGVGSDSDEDGGTDVFAVTDAERRIASTVHQPIDWSDVRRIERMMHSRRQRPPGAPGRTNVRKTEEDVWLEAGAYDGGAGDDPAASR